MSTRSESPREQLAAQLLRLRDEGLWGIAAPGPSAAPGPGSAVPIAAASGSDAPLIAAGVDADPLPPADVQVGTDRSETLATVAREAASCTACRLCETRHSVVFGVGDPHARVMFIGEGPGHDEDLRGEPFVGAAGAVLDRIIVAMGLSREQVYIANTVKCRPPRNRNPEPAELAACRHFLLRQVKLVAPRVIVLLGRVAAQAVLQVSAPLGALRGRWLEWQGIAVMCTYHPAYLLRKPQDKRKTWNDIQSVMRLLDGHK